MHELLQALDVAVVEELLLKIKAVGSPHVLQLSGVGEPETLSKAGIPVHHVLPGVGRNFQDHYIARMSCEVRGLETLNERGRGLSFANEVRRYFASGTGMLTYALGRNSGHGQSGDRKRTLAAVFLRNVDYSDPPIRPEP